MLLSRKRKRGWTGRDTVAPADLIILRHYLWTAPEERAIIHLLVQMCSDPFKNRFGWYPCRSAGELPGVLKMTPAQRQPTASES